MATVPIDLALNLAVGSSAALVGRPTLASQSLLRSTPLWALLAFEALVFAPVGGYLLWRFPDWSLMYLVAPHNVPAPLWTLALGYPLAAILGFAVTRTLLLRGSWAAGIAVCIAGVLLSMAITFFGRAQLSVVGTTTAFRRSAIAGHSGGTLMATHDSPLAYLLVAAAMMVIGTWAFAIWRLRLFGRAARFHETQLADSMVRGAPRGGTVQLEKKGKAAAKGRKRNAQ